MNELADREPVTIGNWLLTYLLLMIPVVNLIMIFVWAFGKGTPESKANWAKALLILGLIGIGVWLVLALLMAAGMFAMQSGRM